ncbi:MAG: archaellin/type IV pilin N-terminal domain-containing protein [Nitrososphaerales archaeon]
MNTKQLLKEKKAISPIIATLLLILIAIAAGVVVYAYVIGFVGNSTQNSGATTDTLSVDQLTLSSKATNVPATAFVRNEGPSTEFYNTGFYLKGSSLNDQVGPAVTVEVTITATTGGSTATNGTVDHVTLTYQGSNTINVNVFLTGSCALGTGAANPKIALSVTGFGVTNTLSATACTNSASTPYTVALSSLSFTVSSDFSSSTGATLNALVSSTSTGGANPSTFVVGTIATAGTLSSGINSVAEFTLAPQSTSTNVASNNPLTAGSTYTFQVTGTDGGSAVASAKSS